MRIRSCAVAALTVSLLAPGAVRAEGESEAAATAAGDDPGDPGEPRLIPSSSGGEEVGSTRFGHHKQFGIAAQFVSGSRFIKTWDADDYCGDRGESSTGNATYCFSRVPVTLDLTVSYGLTPKLELMFEMRLGLERDFGSTQTSGNGPRLRHYAPGVRFYFDDRGMAKFFSTAQVSLDATGYEDASGDSRGADVAFRNANGIFLDFHDAYGAYAFFGEEVAFKRWLEVGVEFGVGIQGRYP